MAPSKLRKAIGAVKDRTSISLAKVGSSTSLADLEVAIVKATRHDEYPAEERHIREILSLTRYSSWFIRVTVSSIARRLNKTKNWTVALKTLVLIQRLLADGDPAYEQEIFFATRQGTRLLNLSDFRDSSRSNSWDYSAFVRTYALYLDEGLELKMLSRRGKRSSFGMNDEEQENGALTSRNCTPVRDMKIEQIFSRMQHLQQLLERLLACRPTGAATSNRIVIVALYPIVKESFHIYYDITETMSILIDRFMELEVRECVKVYDMFCRSTKQFDELNNFYGWCKTYGIARSSEYPEVEIISAKKLALMDEYIRERATSARTERLQLRDEPEEEEEEETNKEPEPEETEEDMNATKALPPPEDSSEEAPVEKEEKKEEKRQEMGDLLNLGEDAVSSEDHANTLALALFDCEAQGPNDGPKWEAFANANDADWETALVQSASNLSQPKASLGGGFDALLLDGMYQQGATMSAMRSVEASGSASSVALGSAGRPAMLALPAPPTANSGGGSTSTTTTSADPFAASVAIPPPSYVQMSDLEKKQHMLVEEQVLWEKYARNGMQGQLALEKLQADPLQVNPYHPGAYSRPG